MAKAKATLAPAEDRFLNLDTAAQHTGMSPWHLRAAVKKGLLPRYRSGPGSKARILIKLSDLLDYIRKE
jgi:hypothetical protein